MTRASRGRPDSRAGNRNAVGEPKRGSAARCCRTARRFALPLGSASWLMIALWTPGASIGEPVTSGPAARPEIEMPCVAELEAAPVGSPRRAPSSHPALHGTLTLKYEDEGGRRHRRPFGSNQSARGRLLDRIDPD
jgi:hypothetical protein